MEEVYVVYSVEEVISTVWRKYDDCNREATWGESMGEYYSSLRSVRSDEDNMNNPAIISQIPISPLLIALGVVQFVIGQNGHRG